MVINEVKTLIFELCKKNDIRWRYHITSTVKYAKILGKKFKADLEVVELASWLHDIASIKGENEDHHIKGAKMAEKILLDLKFNKNKIEKIVNCILSHMRDNNYPPVSLEQKIVASADGMSDFDHFDLTCHRFFLRYTSPEKARIMILDKYERAYLKVMDKAKYLVKPKYEAIKILLE